jgi:large subunit ribosomal protein L15
MKLHDLRPAEGSRKERTRVGRGIAAGKGKTAGRGTKGQKARAGGSIPAWFEGGQTPLHMRIPKLRGFKNRFKIVYEVVNVGDIGAAAERGAFELEAADAKPTAATKAPAQITVNQDILRAVGLVRSLDKPLKILGNGELSTPLFVVADAFTASARAKIEAAGGTVNVLEVPTAPFKAIGLEPAEAGEPAKSPRAEAAAAPADTAEATDVEVRAPRKRRTADEPAEAGAETPSPDTDETAATAKPKRAAQAARAARAEAADTDTVEPSTETEAESATQPETQAASAATDEAETTSGDDA